MSAPSTLYRFRVDLSDVERGVYAPLDFRVAQHPSEGMPYFLTRVLAYALNVEPDAFPPLQFNPAGLSDSEEPCLQIPGANGGVRLWIEIGNPSARKLHKASKAAEKVRVYTYRETASLLRDVAANRVHRAEDVEVFALAPAFFDRVGKILERDNRWSLMLNDGTLILTAGERSEETGLDKIPLV